MINFLAIESWIEFAVRWLHVITGIAWIGSSFYFIALDLGLHRDRNLPSGADGEEWQVHGGGFYHIQKYLVAPEQMPGDLVWFKWESYMTWLSGFAMLILVYYLGAEFYLVDPQVMDLPIWGAIVISLLSLSIGWLAYDFLCKSKFGEDNTRLMIFLFGVLVVMAWGYTQVFSGRAALLHLGAFTATIMTANVFFQIMPNQRIVVADLKPGRVPDARYGRIAKLRSTHNNYLTLPVVFPMLSNHYPLAFATEHAWIIAALIFLTGVTIRHYFNTLHRTGAGPHWTWAVTVLIMVLIAWLSTFSGTGSLEAAEARALSPQDRRHVEAPGFEDAYLAVIGNCSMCHARTPAWEGIWQAAKAVYLETEADVARHATQIYLQAGLSRAMPPPNAFPMPDEARAAITAWIRGVRGES